MQNEVFRFKLLMDSLILLSSIIYFDTRLGVALDSQYLLNRRENEWVKSPSSGVLQDSRDLKSIKVPIMK